MSRPNIIHTNCHGCKAPMSFERVPVKITELTGEVRVFSGKSDAPWICSTCREDPSKLKAARVAAGLPAKPDMPEEFDADAEELAV